MNHNFILVGVKCATTPGLMTLNIMKFSIMGLFVTITIRTLWQNLSKTALGALSCLFYYYSDCHDSECGYAECLHAECHDTM